MSTESGNDGSHGLSPQVSAFLSTCGEPHRAVLAALLDAHLIYAAEKLEGSSIEPAFASWWPQTALEEVLQDLEPLLTRRSGESFSLPDHLRDGSASWMEDVLKEGVVQLPAGSLSYRDLLTGFARYLQEEDPAVQTLPTGIWGGVSYRSAGQTHHVLLRPHPLQLRPHPEQFFLLCGSLPGGLTGTIVERYAVSMPLRKRLALFNPGRGEKINLTRSAVFVHFERYLQRVHGLRSRIPPALSTSLEDHGVLSLRMG